MLLNGGYGSCVVGELDHDTAAFGYYMLSGESDQNLNISLTNIEFILRAHHFQRKSTDTTPQLQPPVGGCNSVSNGLGPPTRPEGVALERSINS